MTLGLKGRTVNKFIFTLVTNEHVYSLKAEINTENTINKKVKVKLYRNGRNKKIQKRTRVVYKQCIVLVSHRQKHRHITYCPVTAVPKCSAKIWTKAFNAAFN